MLRSNTLLSRIRSIGPAPRVGPTVVPPPAPVRVAAPPTVKPIGPAARVGRGAPVGVAPPRPVPRPSRPVGPAPRAKTKALTPVTPITNGRGVASQLRGKVKPPRAVRPLDGPATPPLANLPAPPLPPGALLPPGVDVPGTTSVMTFIPGSGPAGVPYCPTSGQAWEFTVYVNGSGEALVTYAGCVNPEGTPGPTQPANPPIASGGAATDTAMGGTPPLPNDGSSGSTIADAGFGGDGGEAGSSIAAMDEPSGDEYLGED